MTRESALRLRGAAFWALLSILCFWALAFGLAAFQLGTVGRANPEGVQWALAFTALLLLGLLLGVLIAGGWRFGAAVRATFLAATVVLAFAAAYAGWQELPLATVFTSSLALALIPGGLFLIVFLVFRTGAPSLPRSVLAALVTVSVFAAGQFLLVPAPLISPADDTPALGFAALVEPREYALAQTVLLDAQIAGLADGRNGRPELFALLVGAYADQSVFVSEAEGVKAVLDLHFASAPRSLILGNSLRTPLRYPDADWPNLDAALAALSERMGAEDLLFLYLTSHGNSEVLALTFHPAAGRRDDLTLDAAGLADLVGQHVTNPLVAVISACKSGSFIDNLAAEDRLIITASAADRVSFGCKDGADWTYFGKEFVDVALRGEPDPRKAFVTALPLIEAAEARLGGVEPSQPQISEGATFGFALDRLLAASAEAEGASQP